MHQGVDHCSVHAGPAENRRQKKKKMLLMKLSDGIMIFIFKLIEREQEGALISKRGFLYSEVM